MRYYVEGLQRSKSVRRSAELEAANPEGAARKFVELHPKLDEVRVYSDFNAVWDAVARAPGSPLFVWRPPTPDGALS